MSRIGVGTLKNPHCFGWVRYIGQNSNIQLTSSDGTPSRGGIYIIRIRFRISWLMMRYGKVGKWMDRGYHSPLSAPFLPLPVTLLSLLPPLDSLLPSPFLLPSPCPPLRKGFIIHPCLTLSILRTSMTSAH